jgi:hypothetical protein
MDGSYLTHLLLRGSDYNLGAFQLQVQNGTCKEYNPSLPCRLLIPGAGQMLVGVCYHDGKPLAQI